jgi:hypothetical protein
MSVLAPIRLRSHVLARLLLAALPLLAAAAAHADEPRLSLARGQVEVGRGEGGGWRPAREGEALGAGDAVRTGHDGRAEIDLGGATARLYENSLLRLPESSGTSGVELGEGSSLFDVLRRGEGQGPFEVRTREVVVSVKGTRFGVSLDGPLAAVSVYRGLVGVLAAGATPDGEVLVRDGFAATSGGRGGFELSVLPAFDAWESWTTGGAPPAPPAPASSASAELDAARAAARRDIDSEVRALEAQVDPSSRRDGPEKLRSAAKQDDAARTGSETPDSKTSGPQPPAASLDDVDLAAAPAADATQIEVDPVSAAQKQLDREALDDEVTRTLVEKALQDTTSSAASPSATGGSLPFSIQWITSGGPNHVVIAGTDGGVLADLTKDQIRNDILENGQVDLFGAELLHILDQLDVDPDDFAEKLLDLR